MTRVKVYPDGTVHLPAKLLREAHIRPGARVAVFAGGGQLSLRPEPDALARAYTTYYRGAPPAVRKEQLEIENDFTAADTEVIESPHAPAAPTPRRRLHRPARSDRRRRDS